MNNQQADTSIRSPRVVTTKYPTDDVVVALFDVTQFGAKGDGKTDDTLAFENAFAEAHCQGGGVVFVPDGRYAIYGTLKIPSGVTLRGDWRNPDDTTTSDIGTLLQAYASKGDENGHPFITMMPSSGLKNIAIWYPEQNYKNIQAYPWTIKQASGISMTVENVTLFNSYKGIQAGPEFNELHFIRKVYGTPLRIGIERDATTDVGRLHHVFFRPKYWAESGLPGAPDTPKAEEMLRDWIAANGEGFISAFPAWLWVYNMTLEGYSIGIRMIASTYTGKKGPNGGLHKLNIFNGRIGVQLEETNLGGISFTDSVISASRGDDPIPVLAKDNFFAIAQFNTVTFGGKPLAAIRLDGTGVLTFVNCTFEDWGYKGDAFAIDVRSGTVSLSQCDFKKSKRHIYLGQNVKSAAILGNTFEGNPDIRNESVASKEIHIAHEPINIARMSTRGHVFKTKLPRPYSDYLYNVRDYGAIGNGESDDADAIQAALDMAAKRGGTVYLPAGKYRLEKGIRIPTGVELRGIYDVQHHTTGLGGSELFAYAGKGNADGMPLIILERDAGIRGLTIFYPEQIWNTTGFIPYPWTIQGRGVGVWAKDVILVNPYQGIDFGTYESTGHYIDYVSGAPLKKGIFVGNNSGEGWVENVQFIPHYWGRSSYENRPDESITLRLNTIRTLDAFILGYNADEHVLHTFVYGTNIGIHFIEQEGLGSTSGTIMGHGTDGTETAMQIDGIGNCEFINTQLVAMTSEATKRNLLIGEQVKGTAKFFDTMIWGRPDRSMEIKGGNITLQQCSYMRQGDYAIHVTGGTLEVMNTYFQHPTKAMYIGEDVNKVTVIGSIKPSHVHDDYDNMAGRKFSLQYPINRT